MAWAAKNGAAKGDGREVNIYDKNLGNNLAYGGEISLREYSIISQNVRC